LTMPRSSRVSNATRRRSTATETLKLWPCSRSLEPSGKTVMWATENLCWSWPTKMRCRVLLTEGSIREHGADERVRAEPEVVPEDARDPLDVGRARDDVEDERRGDAGGEAGQRRAQAADRVADREQRQRHERREEQWISVRGHAEEREVPAREGLGQET